jgi:hypothetical protein
MPQTARDPRFVILGLVLLTTLFSACTTTIIESGAAAAVLPQISVERFLQAANSRDLHGMGRIFGTTDGDYMETRRRDPNGSDLVDSPTPRLPDCPGRNGCWAIGSGDEDLRDADGGEQGDQQRPLRCGPDE